MYNVQVLIDLHWPIDRIAYVKRNTAYRLAGNIINRLLDNTCTVTITSKLEPSNIYPGMQEYTLTATINEVK